MCLDSLLTLDVFIGVDTRAAREVLVTERRRPDTSACFLAHARLKPFSKKHCREVLGSYVRKSGSFGLGLGRRLQLSRGAPPLVFVMLRNCLSLRKLIML